MALADVYDALISERVYKPPFTPDQALSMILNGECGTFNPVLLECLREAKDYIEKELEINSLKEMTQNEMQDITAELIAKRRYDRVRPHFAPSGAGKNQVPVLCFHVSGDSV